MLRRRRRVVVLSLMAVTVLLVGVDFARGNTASVDPSTEGFLDGATADDGGEAAPPPPPPITQPSGSVGAPPSPPAPGATVVAVPRSGQGSFRVAGGQSAKAGRGQLLTYRVEAENGSNQDADEFAAEVDDTLSDPRSWTADGRWAFRRASRGRVDFVVRLATPKTVDRICAEGGVTGTNGFVSCRVGPFVMINLDRWVNAVPDYRGDVPLYRKYVINHEVGHRLQHGHEACPGPGRLAPVMQQQTFGLTGCKANGWPFVAGTYVRGPSTNGR
jgi:hypothetical protein